MLDWSSELPTDLRPPQLVIEGREGGAGGAGGAETVRTEHAPVLALLATVQRDGGRGVSWGAVSGVEPAGGQGRVAGRRELAGDEVATGSSGGRVGRSTVYFQR